MDKLVAMSDQEPVEQGDISFNFDIIKFWLMISVRALALPHKLDAKMFAARAWLTLPIRGCSRSWRLPCRGGGARSHALKFWKNVNRSLFNSLLSRCFGLASFLDVHSFPKFMPLAPPCIGFESDRDVKQV